MHNVRVEALAATAAAARTDPEAAYLDVHLTGAWNPDSAAVQFAGDVGYPQGEVTLVADFASFLGGEGRAPAPLAYCFYGAMCCYGATYATQAAMAGVELDSMRISLDLGVDFRTALGLGEFPPMSEFEFLVEVETSASDEEIEDVRLLTDERCPAIWSMNNKVPYTTTAKRLTQ